MKGDGIPLTPACGPLLPRKDSMSAARMVLGMQFFQSLACDMSVDLSRGQIAVPQEHLHDAQVRSMVQQMRRESMSQGMRRELFLHAGFLRIAFDDVPKGLARHAVAAARRKQVVGLPLQQYFNPRALHELLQPVHGLLAQWNQTPP